jgi:Uncharacterized conserved protein (DUF2285)
VPPFTVIAPIGQRRAFDITRTPTKGIIVKTAPVGETLFACHGNLWLKASLSGRSVFDGPFALAVEIDAEHPPTDLLRQGGHWAAVLGGEVATSTLCAKRRCGLRAIEVLRVADALAERASFRAIATALYGERRVADEWDGVSDAMRSRVRRLVKSARGMANGGWARLATPARHQPSGAINSK